MPNTARLAALDRMPGSALISVAELVYLAGRSRSSIWRDVKARRLPSPVVMGPQTRRWRVDDVRVYLRGGQE